MYNGNHAQYLSGEEEDEEDEEGGSQRRRRRRLRKAKKKASIYDVYEPSELERGFFTDRDKDIRVTDMPERFQVCTLCKAVPVHTTEICTCCTCTYVIVYTQ